MTKVQVNNNIYYYEVSSKPNVYIICIAVSIRKHNLWNHFYFWWCPDHSIGHWKVIWFYRKSIHYGSKCLFFSWNKNRPHASPNFDTGQSNFKIDYYRQTYPPPGKLAIIKRNLEKWDQEVMYSLKNQFQIYGFCWLWHTWQINMDIRWRFT